ncbi:hypothetical protein BC936DRAFT_149151 [Jimgerdemannia flammicorona]|uniref:Methyltransferase type 11 domain-containing protein n=1 Tax=Jimgerdemannia flammicorona TaxID=994334 RepID=A0A433D1G4_9FUNG|nr:hypothetical protein BC936DRAFT_149151 [Jimgerdemannia flammicorona]
MLPPFSKWLMVTAFSADDWQNAIREIVRVTAPGGYIELVESEINAYQKGPHHSRWNNAFYAVLASRNIHVNVTTDLGANLRPYVDSVTSDYVSYPLNWGGQVGDMVAQNTFKIMNSVRPQVLPVMGCTEEEYDAIIALSGDEMKRYRTWNNGHYAFGRKSLTTPSVTTRR